MKDDKQKIVTQPLSGFMELLPKEQIAFNEMFDTIRKTYENFGFIPLDTPVLERADVLLAKAGGETEKQIYRFMKGDTDIAMRFDLTVPLARYVAAHYGDVTFPFRRYAMGKVYRGERPQAGRFREFYQCDIDVIGDTTLDVRFDAEMPCVIDAIFCALGFDNFTIRINNRKIFNGLFAELGLHEQSTRIMQSIDRLEKIGRDAVENELRELGLSDDAVAQLLAFVCIGEGGSEVIARLQSLGITHPLFVEGVAELAEVIATIEQCGVSASHFAIDVTIARGLDYYTGTVYETRLDDYPEIGSVCSGGRYDDLASHYTNRTLPGVGISIGLTRLFDQLRKRDAVQIDKATPTRVLVLPMTEDCTPSLALATDLRSRGIATEVSFVTGKMKKRLGYADKLGIPYAIFVGEDEIETGRFTLKDLRSGEQIQLTAQDIIQKLTVEKDIDKKAICA